MKWGRAMAVARMARVAIADREGRVLVGSDQQFGSRGQVVSADYPGTHEDDELTRKCEELISLGASWFHRELCSHDKDYLTPLALLLTQNRRPGVKSLLKYGAAQSIFVYNEATRSLLCTIPFSLQPKVLTAVDPSNVDEHLSHLFSENHIRPEPDIIEILDTFLERHVAKLAENAQRVMGDIGESDDAKLSKTGLSSENFQKGDRVRLRNGVRQSSLAIGKQSKVQLSRNYLEYDDAPMGPLKPGDVGTLIQIKAAYKPYRVQSQSGATWWYRKEAIVREDATGIPDTFSNECLGSFSDGREGIVLSVTTLDRSGSKPLHVVEVASVRDGKACLYTAQDLMFADGMTESASRIPIDWGKRFISKLEVSSSAAEKQNLTDGDPSTYWEVNNYMDHSIAIYLKKPNFVKEVGLIFDEADFSYRSSIDVDVLLGTKKSNLSPQVSETIVSDGTRGPKHTVLLKDHKEQTSVIKIRLSDAKRIRGLTIAMRESLARFRVGDRVKLRSELVKPGFGWNLQNGNEGIVTCAPRSSRKQEQRGLIVSSLRSDEHYFFRSSQLQLAESTRRYELGSFVQLNGRGWDARYRSMESKCLGHPKDSMRGMITDLGVYRDGVQRNIEVTRSYPDGETRRSLYPAVVLLPFSPYSIFSDTDKKTLKDSLKRLVAKIDDSFEVNIVVEMWGLESWSKVWKYLSLQLGPDVVFNEFVAWQRTRAQEPTSAVEKFLESLKESFHLSNEIHIASQSDSLHSTWSCEMCGFSKNTGPRGKCSICGPWRGPWDCNICSAKNSSLQRLCNTCSRHRGCIDLDHTKIIPSTWVLWNAEAEKEVAVAAAQKKERLLEKEMQQTPAVSKKGNQTLGQNQGLWKIEDDLSEGSAEDEEELDSKMEACLNETISAIEQERRPAQLLQKTIRNIAMFHKTTGGVEYYRPILDLNSLVRWQDSGNNTAAHHAAYMGLTSTLKRLCDNGASLWARNRIGETPAALLEGLIGYNEEKYTLHKYIRVGKLLVWGQYKPEKVSEEQLYSEVIKRVMQCQTDYRTDDAFWGVKQKLLSGKSENALEILRELPKGTQKNLRGNEIRILVHLYLALSILNEGYGSKAAIFELEKYLSKLSRSLESRFDPIYFYTIYRMWLLDGRPRSKKFRAYYALMAFKCFDCARDWLSDDDNIQFDETLRDMDSIIHNDIVAHDDEVEPLGPEDPETEWEMAQKKHGISSESIDKLMALTGLKAVKKSAIHVVKNMLLREGRPAEINTDLCMNFLFVGNPGSGKTTAAKLLAEGMAELGFRKDKFEETSAQQILKAQSPVGFFEQLVKKATGGVIFVDEAYRFTPSRPGNQPNDSNYVLDYLLEAVEKPEIRKSTTFILAGYKDEMESLLSYNVGFASRFPHEFNFEDFNEVQIKSILQGMLQERGLQLESKAECNIPLAKILAQRIARYANKKGFGNARAVRNKVDEIVANQTHRLGSKKMTGELISAREYRVLTRTDAIGPPPNLSSSVLLHELNSLVGLSKVKSAVRKLVDLQMRNYDREIAGERPELISLHRVFYGNPGTGKTTLARLYGALLKELGLLSKGDFMQCTPADLTGNVAGGAANNTKAMLDKAKGNVLLIDEAYVLDPKRGSNIYGGNVLDTLVEKLEGDAGSDIAVILAGYKQEMFDMLENNAGLRRRFNIDDFGIHFEDLDNTELKQVFRHSVRQSGLVIKDAKEVEDYVVHVLSQKRRLPNFGNAGTVKSLLNVAKLNKAARISNSAQEQKNLSKPKALPHPDVLLKIDFQAAAETDFDANDAFSKLYNVDHIKDVLFELESLIASAKKDGKDPADIVADMHMVFTGPPGTGKTTVARKFGQLFKKLDLLPSDTVIMTTGTNLQGQYIGETKGKVVKVLNQARGGILLIDEAYALASGKGSYSVEAVDTLVGQITEPDFKGNLIVIMAGYGDKMDEMFQSVNPGFRSRFDKRRVEFPPWTGEQAAKVALMEIEKDGKQITPDAYEDMKRYFSEMSKDVSWASARDVFENILPSMYGKRAARLGALARDRGDIAASGESEGKDTVTLPPPYEASDVAAAFEQALGDRVLQIDSFETLQAAISATKSGDKILIIDFFATWCGPCKKFAPIFAALKKEYKGSNVGFYRIDVDRSQEASEHFSVTNIPTLLFVARGEVVKQTPGVKDAPTMRQYITDLQQEGRIRSTSNPTVREEISGETSSLAEMRSLQSVSKVSAAPRLKSVDDGYASDGFLDAGPLLMSVVKQNIDVAQAEEYRHAGDSDDSKEDDDDFGGQVLAALEEACKQLGYSTKQIASMLRSAERYSQQVIAYIKQKLMSDDEEKIRRALDSQRDGFLARIEELIRQEHGSQTDEYEDVQRRIRQLGRCPMDFDWIREEGGWRCAGGSHWLSDAELNSL